jgi:hypothetical protein
VSFCTIAFLEFWLLPLSLRESRQKKSLLVDAIQCLPKRSSLNQAGFRFPMEMPMGRQFSPPSLWRGAGRSAAFGILMPQALWEACQAVVTVGAGTSVPGAVA